MKILKKLETANRIRREQGWAAVGKKIRFLRFRERERRNYQKWIELCRIDEEKRQKMRAAIAAFSHKPLISIVLPVYNVDQKWLRLCLDSVREQIYENWELCIADDKSPAAHVREVLNEYAALDKRIKTVFREKNGHISNASNSALELATGEFCVLLDHDDELSRDALFFVAKELNEFPETVFIYSDEDMIDERGRRFEPKFKPDFSRDLLYSLNLITHLSAYRTELLRSIGGFRVGFEGSQDYDLALRVIEQIDENRIRHIPRILYHWRAIRGSVAFSPDEKPYAHEQARRAIRDHLARTGRQAEVVPTFWNLHRVSYELPADLPKVSLILAAAENFEKGRTNFIEKTSYGNFEIIESAQMTAESLNRAVAQANGEILCFIYGSFLPADENWLAELTSFAVQNDIGAVGAKLVSDDKTILHGGLVFGADGLPKLAHRYFPADETGNFARLKVVNNFSAVSGLCLAVRRELFQKLGGFDAGNLPNALFDADFCLKLREQNYRVVFVADVEFQSSQKGFEPKSATDAEKSFFSEKWLEFIKKDPFYNPNFSQDSEVFAIDANARFANGFGGIDLE